ncbi:MAG TPA: prepilin-type N-terminal cleavage/methylation domain-containing protein [Candidatus Ozemobacteraceae bacterium]|nr:prepilin-type N-terminal cleavage/methylation domain-containing protein [Candidatus Ozemobacteraceae bacterium]HQG28554.1 prepilin-type N-terminal cleavage/methylation domain-containing protein [Candidatus Ozemobacteraceae bacterium]
MSVTRGFTLVEVLVSMLIMGLTTTGLLQLLDYGGRQYTEIARGWKQREGLSALRRACRQAVAAGNASALSPSFGESVLGSIDTRLRLAGLTVRPCAPRAWFVQVRLFDDANRNGREDDGEAQPLTTWCFCERGDPS